MPRKQWRKEKQQNKNIIAIHGKKNVIFLVVQAKEL